MLWLPHPSNCARDRKHPLDSGSIIGPNLIDSPVPPLHALDRLSLRHRCNQQHSELGRGTGLSHRPQPHIERPYLPACSLYACRFQNTGTTNYEITVVGLWY